MPTRNEKAITKLAARRSKHSSRKGKAICPSKSEQAIIVGAVAKGNHFSTAIRMAGVSVDRFQGWMDRGRKGDPTLRPFVDAIEQAEAEAEQRALEVIMDCAVETKVTVERKGEGEGQSYTEVMTRKDWRAAAFVLQHRYAERWATMRKLQHSGALTMRQVVVLHDDDPTLKLEEWTEEGPRNPEFEVNDGPEA